MSEEPKRTDAIVDRYQDDAAPRVLATLVSRLIAPTDTEAATVNPNHHGHLLATARAGRPNVQKQAVFVGGWKRIADQAGESRILRRGRAKLDALANRVPMGNVLRWLPTKLANRRRGEWDAPKSLQAA